MKGLIDMLEQSFQEVYAKFKLNFYRGIFERVHDRLGSLNVTEAFAVEAIYALREPTIGEFAESIGISQPNATYKVNSLIKKGYVQKINNEKDKREYHLRVTQRFLDYYNINSDYIHEVMERIKARFTPEETEKFDEMLRIISRELMPENSQINTRYGELAANGENVADDENIADEENASDTENTADGE